MSAKLPPPMFIAGSVGLDFLNSIATPEDTPVDWIGNGDDYLAWLHTAGLLPDADLTAIRKSVSARELDSAATQARSLREWFREFVHERQGRALSRSASDDLARLNELLERDELHWELTTLKPAKSRDAAPPFEMALRRRWTSSKSLLLPAAEAIAQCVVTCDFRYIKQCEGAACTLLFFDDTRRRARRWCSMAVCGNRAKQAEHRKRTRGSDA